MYPLTLKIGEQFTEEYPESSVSVASTGTGGGFSDFFCLGKTEINDASRPISDEEYQLCEDNNVEYHRFQVATDALTVVVNNDADWLDCVKPAELAKIWKEDGAETWSDVRDEWPAKPIALYGPTSDSGTFDYFAEQILESETHRQDYDGTEQDSKIINNVNSSQYSIGYLGFAYYTQNSERITALALENNGTCVTPSLSTAESGEYSPLSRPLFIYVAQSSLEDQTVRAFLRYYLDLVDTEIVSEVGYVPLNEDTASAQRDKLSEIVS